MSQTSKTLFRCNIDKIFYSSKEQAKKQTGSIVKRMKTRTQVAETTAEVLAKAVTRGLCFTTAELNGRQEKDFISQQLVVADIDNEADIKKAIGLDKNLKDKKITLKEAYEILEKHGIEKTPLTTVEEAISILENNGIEFSFIYYSFSHTITHPKFRIVCVLQEKTTDSTEAKRLNQYFISLFPQADKSCHNLERFYYGTDKGLATEVYDRTAKIIVPENFTLKEQKMTSEEKINTKISKPTSKKEQTLSTVANGFDLKQAIRDFNFLEYVEQTTHTVGERKGKDVLINPCPFCGHNDHFFIDTDRNIYYSHSDKDIDKKDGNIINYLVGMNNWDIKKACDYFIYDIMKQDREVLKMAYKQAKEQEHIKTETLNNTGKQNLPYITADSEMAYAFYKIPQSLYDNPVFDSIDYGSKLLYAAMLSRVKLSVINKSFIDEKGYVYIVYTLNQVMEIMRCSKPTATKMINQLDNIGLIEKHKQGLGKASILYVKDISFVKAVTSKKKQTTS